MKPNFKMKNIFTFFVFSLLIFNACNKENNSENSLLRQKDMEEEPNEGMTILGEQCPNPYSVENMTIAFDSLADSF